MWFPGPPPCLLLVTRVLFWSAGWVSCVACSSTSLEKKNSLLYTDENKAHWGSAEFVWLWLSWIESNCGSLLSTTGQNFLMLWKCHYRMAYWWKRLCVPLGFCLKILELVTSILRGQGMPCSVRRHIGVVGWEGACTCGDWGTSPGVCFVPVQCFCQLFLLVVAGRYPLMPRRQVGLWLQRVYSWCDERCVLKAWRFRQGQSSRNWKCAN